MEQDSKDFRHPRQFVVGQEAHDEAWLRWMSDSDVQRRLLLQPAIALVMSQSGRPCNLLHQPVDSIKTENSAAVGPRVFRFHRLSLQTIFGEAADT